MYNLQTTLFLAAVSSTLASTQWNSLLVSPLKTTTGGQLNKLPHTSSNQCTTNPYSRIPRQSCRVYTNRAKLTTQNKQAPELNQTQNKRAPELNQTL